MNNDALKLKTIKEIKLNTIKMWDEAVEEFKKKGVEYNGKSGEDLLGGENHYNRMLDQYKKSLLDLERKEINRILTWK